MKLTSKAVVDGYLKPEYGINTPNKEEIVHGIPQRSFPLEWDEVPEGVQSFAIICMDYDNVQDEGVPWVHWLVSDIPADCRSLEENEAAGGKLIQGMTSWALPYGPYEGIPQEVIANYGGPAPGRTHEYEVEIFALDCKPDLQNGFYYNKIRKVVQNHAIDSALLKFNYVGADEYNG